MQKQQQISKSGILDRRTRKRVADSIADEMASRFYYKMVMLKFLPEIKEIEARRANALKGKDIYKFFDSLAAK